MRLPLLLLALATLSGCEPEIGDSCDVDSDCSSTGERICDSTQPGGYCTIFACDPTSCPEDESVCVAFGNSLSTASGCQSSGSVSPYTRNFCMKRCDGDGDCRGGYVCVDMSKENPWSADVVTSDPPTHKVCVYPYSGEEIPGAGEPDARSGGYCSATGHAFGGAPNVSSGGAGPGGTTGLGGAP